MMSFEIAKRLYELGFPQPTPADNQMWYQKDGGVVYYGHTTDSWGEIEESVKYYAPTLQDILREIGQCTLELKSDGVWSVRLGIRGLTIHEESALDPMIAAANMYIILL